MLSIYLFVFAGFAPLGGLLAGWLADVGGTRLAFSVAGAAGLAISVLAATSLRAASAPACSSRRSSPQAVFT